MERTVDDEFDVGEEAVEDVVNETSRINRSIGKVPVLVHDFKIHF